MAARITNDDRAILRELVTSRTTTLRDNFGADGVDYQVARDAIMEIETLEALLAKLEDTQPAKRKARAKKEPAVKAA